jgi:uncharacterized membrane protein
MNWGNRLVILLAVSIGLNLVLAGVMVGSRLARRDTPHGEGFPPGKHPGPEIDSVFKSHRAEFGERRRATARARSDVQEILNREPFDRAALDAALAKLRAETEQSQQMLHRALADAAANAPPERRRELGKMVSMGRGRRGFRDRRPDPSAD